MPRLISIWHCARFASPNDLGTLYLLERSYLETKQFQTALPTFERLQSPAPNSAWVRILWGQAEDAPGNCQRAMKGIRICAAATAARAYEGCLCVDRERADVRYRLARVYKKLKRPEDYVREPANAQRLQKKKREEQETLMRASGADGDPTGQGGEQLRLPASNEKIQ